MAKTCTTGSSVYSEQEGEDGEECPGARDQARRRAAASAHEAAARAAALAEIATKATAAAPGDNAQQRGTKRSAHAAGHDAETIGDATAAQRDASARGAAAAEEIHGPGAPGHVGLEKPENWDSMSQAARKSWKKRRAKYKGNTRP